jgi:transposase
MSFMSPRELSDICHKLRVLNFVKANGNVSRGCRRFGISRDTFYRWKNNYEQKGEKALISSKPCPQNPKIRVPKHVEEQIIYLRTTYHLGQLKISWYLKRYHDIKVSQSGVYSVLKRNGLNKLPQNQRKRGPCSSLDAMKNRYPAIEFR